MQAVLSRPGTQTHRVRLVLSWGPQSLLSCVLHPTKDVLLVAVVSVPSWPVVALTCRQGVAPFSLEGGAVWRNDVAGSCLRQTCRPELTGSAEAAGTWYVLEQGNSRAQPDGTPDRRDHTTSPQHS